MTDGQFDLPRAKEGGVDAMFFSIFVTEDYYPQRFETKQAFRLIDLALTQLENESRQDRAGAERLRHRAHQQSGQDRRRARSGRRLRSRWRSRRPSRPVPAGAALGAALGAQLGEQFRRFLLLAAEVERSERTRPRRGSRDEPARHGDQRLARVRRRRSRRRSKSARPRWWRPITACAR